ncbi:hypothetical protein, partial [Vibrio alginolyticus]|uniref:hypothetical protein n=1 Tax=Vibrio alginolyticus TaxID=663 RepID=UPI00128F321D
LKVGVNNIERLSTDSLFVAKDWPGTDYFYKKLLKAIEGNEPFTYGDKVFGFPNNLYLPKGRVGGMPYKLFVFVYPVEESKMTTFSLPMFGKFYYDGKSFGYPLDRPMYPYFFNLSNVFFKDVFIYFGKEYYPEHYSYGYHRYQQYKQFHYKDVPVERSYYQAKEHKPFYMDYEKTMY